MAKKEGFEMAVDSRFTKGFKQYKGMFNDT